jgi:LPXTG-motif cell wall-anchored protein
LTINMAAPASTTTTTVPTLPRTGGSSAPYAFAGFLMAAAGVALRRTRRQS